MAQGKDARAAWDEFVSDMDSLEWTATSAFPPRPTEKIEPIWKGPRPPGGRKIDYSDMIGMDPYSRYDIDVEYPDRPGEDVPKFTNRPELAGKDGWILREDIDPEAMVIQESQFSGQMDFEGIQALTTRMYGKPMFDVREGFKPGHIKRSDVRDLEKGEKDTWIPGKLADDGTGIPTNEEDMKVAPPQMEGQPPKGYQTPAEKVAFFKENRSKFRQSIYQKQGGNPYDIDVREQANKLIMQDMPRFFAFVFQSEGYTIRDIQKLNSDELNTWKDRSRQRSGDIIKNVQSDTDQKIRSLNKQMSQYDHRTSVEESKVKAIISRIKEDRSVRAESRAQRGESRAQRREEREVATRGKPSEASAMSKIVGLEDKLSKLEEDAKTDTALTSAKAVIKSGKASTAQKASAKTLIERKQKERVAKEKAIKKQIDYYRKYAPQDEVPGAKPKKKLDLRKNPDTNTIEVMTPDGQYREARRQKDGTVEYKGDDGKWRKIQ